MIWPIEIIAIILSYLGPDDVWSVITSCARFYRSRVLRDHCRKRVVDIRPRMRAYETKLFGLRAGHEGVDCSEWSRKLQKIMIDFCDNLDEIHWHVNECMILLNWSIPLLTYDPVLGAINLMSKLRSIKSITLINVSIRVSDMRLLMNSVNELIIGHCMIFTPLWPSLDTCVRETECTKCHTRGSFLINKKESLLTLRVTVGHIYQDPHLIGSKLAFNADGFVELLSRQGETRKEARLQYARYILSNFVDYFAVPDTKIEVCNYDDTAGAYWFD